VAAAAAAGGAENAGVENRSDNAWKVVKTENSKILGVSAGTKRSTDGL